MAEVQRELTKNQSLVFRALSDAAAPLSAYSILDQLRDHGFRAPVQVYRALDRLLEEGLIHRLETLNAYVACSHAHRHQGAVVFAICNTCGEVQEFTDEVINARLSDWTAARNFAADKAIVELRGRCGHCGRAGGKQETD